MSTTFNKVFRKKHKSVVVHFWGVIAHYIINIYRLIRTVCPCGFGGFCVVVQPSTVGGCAVWLSVRPFGCCGRPDTVKMSLLCPLSAFVLSLSLALAVLGRSFAVPCRVRWWGGVFACPLLFVACGGVCRLCSVVALAFGLWWGYPSLFLGE